uniref:E3 ubiquitin-protein ligase KCMF1 n=1 Tax=Amphiprion ocellaris TaxID=80972 RepID=A0AAQ5Y398_AMPOC
MFDFTLLLSVFAGVSCDACLKGNFRGRRFKCLICYDYDLCASCYESGAEHTHTKLSFTCPYCGKMGFTETSLQEHVTSEHSETSTEVICPICAALPGGDPNHVTDDFTAHLTLEHRAPRDLISFFVRHVRRMFHPGRGLGGPRARRTNMHFTSGSTGGLSSSSSQSSTYTPSNREAMDPIAELLSQLSGVRRAAGGQINSSGPSASQLQQLQMQLQLERQQAQAARQQVETGRHATRRSNNPGNTGTTIPPPSTATANTATVGESNPSSSSHSSQFLLARLNEPKMSEAERQFLEGERADRSLFVQELLLSTLMHEESSSSDEDERRDFADFGAMGCVDIMPLDVALENLQLRESSSTGKEPPPPPL